MSTINSNLYTIVDINECEGSEEGSEEGSTDPDGVDNCSSDATCTNTPGSFECTCEAGFVDIFGDGTKCDGKNAPTLLIFYGLNQTILDINECAEGSEEGSAEGSTELEGINNCSKNGTCTNKPGSFSCACNPGFIGNGVTCIG